MSITCDICGSERVLSIGIDCQEYFWASYQNKIYEGKQAIKNTGLNGDKKCVIFDFCLECGKIQGKFPAKEPEFPNEPYNGL